MVLLWYGFMHCNWLVSYTCRFSQNITQMAKYFGEQDTWNRLITADGIWATKNKQKLLSSQIIITWNCMLFQHKMDSHKKCNNAVFSSDIHFYFRMYNVSQMWNSFSCLQIYSFAPTQFFPFIQGLAAVSFFGKSILLNMCFNDVGQSDYIEIWLFLPCFLICQNMAW